MGRLLLGLLVPLFVAGYLVACGSGSHSAAATSGWRTDTATLQGFTVTLRCRGAGIGGCKILGRPAPALLHKIAAEIAAPITAPVARWVKLERLPPSAHPGADLFAENGCTACHTYLGVGSRNLNAPDLTNIGNRDLGISFEIRYLRCPSCVVRGSPMPHFNTLSNKMLRQLAIFLEDSNGRRN